jgi:hypothetical protein
VQRACCGLIAPPNDTRCCSTSSYAGSKQTTREIPHTPDPSRIHLLAALLEHKPHIPAASRSFPSLLPFLNLPSNLSISPHQLPSNQFHQSFNRAQSHPIKLTSPYLTQVKVLKCCRQLTTSAPPRLFFSFLNSQDKSLFLAFLSNCYH